MCRRNRKEWRKENPSGVSQSPLGFCQWHLLVGASPETGSCGSTGIGPPLCSSPKQVDNTGQLSAIVQIGCCSKTKGTVQQESDHLPGIMLGWRNVWSSVKRQTSSQWDYHIDWKWRDGLEQVVTSAGKRMVIGRMTIVLTVVERFWIDSITSSKSFSCLMSSAPWLWNAWEIVSESAGSMRWEHIVTWGAEWGPWCRQGTEVEE